MKKCFMYVLCTCGCLIKVVANVLTSFCSVNTGFPLSSSFLLSFVVCSYGASPYILFLIKLYFWMEGVGGFFLHFAHNCCRWKEEFSDKQIALFAPPASRSQTLSRSSRKLKECDEMHSPLRTSFIRSPNYNNNPQHCHFGRAVILPQPHSHVRFAFAQKIKILADGFRASQGL